MTVLLAPSLAYGVIAPALLRDLALNLLAIESADVADIQFVLGASVEEAATVWEGLRTDGYIVLENDRWVIEATKTRALANARIGKAFPRAKAEGLLTMLVANAKAINALPPTTRDTYWITKIAVFGSYLSDKPLLADLDVAFDVETRPGQRDWMVNALMQGLDPFSKTRGLLRPKSQYISLTPFGQLEALNCPYRTLYSFDPHDVATGVAKS